MVGGRRRWFRPRRRPEHRNAEPRVNAYPKVNVSILARQGGLVASPPYMKLYIADYHVETTDLDVVGHGAYLLLLMAMWRAGGKLPRDESKLARLAKCTPEQWATVRDDVMAHFKARGGVIRHPRVDKEIAAYDDVVGGASTAGKASGLKRANKNNNKTTNVRSENVERFSNQPEPEPEPERTLSLIPREDSIFADFIRVRDLGGDALASMATHPNIASLHTLNALLKGDNPCDLEEDVYPAVIQAAAWHRARAGPGSMTSWTTTIRMAAENRDRRLAGNPTPVVRSNGHERPNGFGAANGDARRSRTDLMLEAGARVAARRTREAGGGSVDG